MDDNPTFTNPVQSHESPDLQDTDPRTTDRGPGNPFVRALYDYTAATPTELDLREGDRVEVLNRDASGWWYGRCGTRQGWFPSNFCNGLIIGFVRVLNDYHSDVPRRLDLKQGDVVDVDDNNSQDYWHGSIGSRSGWFDPSYCDVIEEDDVDDTSTPDGSEVGDELEIAELEEEVYRAGIWL